MRLEPGAIVSSHINAYKSPRAILIIEISIESGGEEQIEAGGREKKDSEVQFD